MSGHKNQLFDSILKSIPNDTISINNSSISPLELVSKVDSFYNNAWTKLVVLFGIIGVIIPIVIGLIQYIKNKKELEYLKAEILENLKKEINDYLINEKQEINNFLDKKIAIIQNATEGVSYSIQATLLLEKKEYEKAYLDYINCMTCFLVGEEFSNFRETKKEFIEKCVPNINLNMLKSPYMQAAIKYSDYYQSDKLLERLTVLGQDFSIDYFELQIAFEKINNN